MSAKRAKRAATKPTVSPAAKATPKSNGAPASKRKAKPTLFEAVDAGPARAGTRTKEENRRLLDKLGNGNGNGKDSDSDSGSGLSELGDTDDADEGFEFEDVDTSQPQLQPQPQPSPGKKRKVAPAANHDDGSSDDSGSSEESEDDDDNDEDEDNSLHFEDAMAAPVPSSSKQPEPEIADINISVNDDGTVYHTPLVSAATGKKAPSKKEREARVLAHEMHVQGLMWHNAVRNCWLQDREVRELLVGGLSLGVKAEVERWRKAMGWETEAKEKGKKGGRGGKDGKGKDKGRDWGAEAKGQEQGVPDLSRGDPLLRLLKILIAYWRKRFTITAPGLRKLGYMPLKRLRDEIRGWQGNRGDSEEYGERIESKAQFRKAAKECEGSRDVGAQLFVALLRGLGIETRMVANLQPAGIGFGKAEEAEAKKTRKEKKAEVVDLDSDKDTEVKVKGATPKKAAAGKKGNGKTKVEKPSRKSSRGGKGKPIDLDGSDSELSELSDSDAVDGNDDDPAEDDDDSVVDITPAKPKPNKKYDRDLAFPTYWAEVLSPVSNTYIPVDPLILSTIASNAELLLAFEPRGKKAEKAKQGICYTIAHSPDGSAKDVTVRYLKKHQLPGKTKGFRVGPEKIAIRNKHGKVRKYEEYDWFKTVMSGYTRPHAARTAADDLEESTDLKPFKPATAKKEVEKESLAWYKASAEFCLEHFLRREEALLPDAKPVREFTAGKGDKTTTYPVYKRADVVACKTVESWHKEGRALLPAQHPRKLVPMRAVTLVRKREMEDAKRETGEPLKQGLYSREQTDWIIPPPIVDGRIPKNAFGNMDVYVPTMVPEGAVHLPLKGSAKLCRRLEVDYAEACTGFEFGKQRAVPVLTGVVVAEEHEILVRDAWREEQKEVRRKEDEKRRAVSLHWWRKMVMGLRIVERMREDYAGAGAGEESNPFVRKAEREGRSVKTEIDLTDDGEDGGGGGGGFFVPGHEEEEVPQTRKRKPSSTPEGDDGPGGFLPDADEEDVDMGGGFLVEENPEDAGTNGASATGKGQTPITPVSLQAMHKSANAEGDGDGDEPIAKASSEEHAKPNKAARKPQHRNQSTPAAPKSKPKTKTTADAKPISTRKTPAKTPRKPKKAATTAPSSSEASEQEEDYDQQSEPGSEGDTDASALSELGDVSSRLGSQDDAELDARPEAKDISKTNGRTNGKAAKAVASSPRVVVRSTRANGKSASASARKIGSKKATPVKSRYFARGTGDSEEEEEDDDESSGEESEEVVKPRSTTARTRGRK